MLKNFPRIGENGNYIVIRHTVNRCVCQTVCPSHFLVWSISQKLLRYKHETSQVNRSYLGEVTIECIF